MIHYDISQRKEVASEYLLPSTPLSQPTQQTADLCFLGLATFQAHLACYQGIFSCVERCNYRQCIEPQEVCEGLRVLVVGVSCRVGVAGAVDQNVQSPKG